MGATTLYALKQLLPNTKQLTYPSRCPAHRYHNPALTSNPPPNWRTTSATVAAVDADDS